MTLSAEVDEGQHILAAVDLGSNSFHMLVVRATGQRFEVIDRLKEPVRLAAGIDDNQQLSAEARERALACLQRFGQRLNALPSVQVRAVGTNTLRRAQPDDDFLQTAEQALGHPIDIIYGVEEARLIYAGVSLDLGDSQPQRLVVDIGGGSTELILGHDTAPRLLESLSLGAVSWSLRFFPKGKVTKSIWREAVVEARLHLAPLTRTFCEAGWQRALGASGSIKAILAVCHDEGWSDNVITPEALHKLSKALIKAGSVDKADFDALSDDRRPVFAGAVAILTAIFESFGVESMSVSGKAVREGMLIDMLGHEPGRDPRSSSVKDAQTRYNVDTGQAERVSRTAHALQADADSWLPVSASGCANALHWAAQLHEIGMAIAHKGYHKHGAYIVTYADLHGFSRTAQQILAALIRLHRGKFRRAVLKGIPAAYRQGVERLALILRLAVLLNRDRDPQRHVPVQLSAKGKMLQLSFETGWLDSQPLTRADLTREQKRLDDADFKLMVIDGAG